MNLFQKNNKKLNSLRGSFFLLGLIVACSFTFLAFEWTSSYAIITPKSPTVEIDDFGILPPITYRNEVKPPEVKIKPPSFNNEEFIITEVDPVEPVDKTDPFIEAFNPDEYTPDERIIEPPLPATYRAGVMPHFKDCKTLNEQEREICTNNEMKKHFADKTHIPTNIKIRGKATYRAFVYFEINTKGKVINVKILNDDEHKIPKELEREAYNAVKSLPLFIPGNNHGKKVTVRYKQTIKFTVG